EGRDGGGSGRWGSAGTAGSPGWWAIGPPRGMRARGRVSGEPACSRWERAARLPRRQARLGRDVEHADAEAPARPPLGRRLERDVAVGRPVAVAAEAPAEVVPAVADEEADDPVPAVLGDVLQLVAEEPLVALASGAHGDDAADGDA